MSATGVSLVPQNDVCKPPPLSLLQNSHRNVHTPFTKDAIGCCLCTICQQRNTSAADIINVENRDTIHSCNVNKSNTNIVF